MKSLRWKFPKSMHAAWTIGHACMYVRRICFELLLNVIGPQNFRLNVFIYSFMFLFFCLFYINCVPKSYFSPFFANYVADWRIWSDTCTRKSYPIKEQLARVFKEVGRLSHSFRILQIKKPASQPAAKRIN